MKSLQEMYAPNSFCFGCGPKNPKGLRIRSFVVGDEVAVTIDLELLKKAAPAK